MSKRRKKNTRVAALVKEIMEVDQAEHEATRIHVIEVPTLKFKEFLLKPTPHTLPTKQGTSEQQPKEAPLKTET